MLLPVLSKARLKAQGLQCLNNHRQLCLAWKMYSDDNDDQLLYASGSWPYTAHDPGVWVSGWMDFDPNNRSNWDVTQDIEQSPLWPYCGRSAAIWKCPADHSSLVVNGKVTPRVRSMSMNVWLGGFKGVDYGLSGDPAPQCPWRRLLAGLFENGGIDQSRTNRGFCIPGHARGQH